MRSGVSSGGSRRNSSEQESGTMQRAWSRPSRSMRAADFSSFDSSLEIAQICCFLLCIRLIIYLVHACCRLRPDSLVEGHLTIFFTRRLCSLTTSRTGNGGGCFSLELWLLAYHKQSGASGLVSR